MLFYEPQGNVSRKRKDTIAVTVRLDPELSLRLKRYGVSFRPRQTHQDIIEAAIERYLAQAKG